MEKISHRCGIRDRIETRIFLCLSFLVAMLGRRTMVRMGMLAGGLVYCLWGARRRIALENLDHAFGHAKGREEKEWIAREAFRNIGATMLELAWGMRRMNRGVFFRIIEVEGLEVLKSALSRNRGVLLLPAHYGNWEIMANAIGYLNFNAHYVAKRLKNPYMDKLVNDYRCETGNRVIFMNGASREMRDVLKKGGVVATLLDQKVPLHRGGILVKFFGRDAATTPLIAELHLSTLAPLFLIRCYPLTGGRCRLVFGPEVTYVPSGRHVRSLTQKCTDAIESYIRETPQFWIWGHRRWKLNRGRTA
jgi:Kdo2-lipid IVA lauroyltransferase/acyltransferase